MSTSRLNDKNNMESPCGSVPKRIALVVPTRGRSAIVRQCLEAMVVAVGRSPEFQLIVADNNIDEECSRELEALSDRAMIVRTKATTVGAVRNDGVAASDPRAEIICFVDSDCLVPADFLERVDLAFGSRNDEVIGCKVMSPVDGHWTEVVSDALHRDGSSGPRQALNTGCLAVRRSALERVGGFSAELPSNEDYDLCNRLKATGSTIWQDERLAVVHLGNPKTVAGYFGRMLWHGRGVVDARGRMVMNRMLMFVLLNALLTAIGLVAAVSTGFSSIPALLFLLGSIAATPLAFVVLRTLQFKRYIPILPSVALMLITLWARLFGLVLELRARQALRLRTT